MKGGRENKVFEQDATYGFKLFTVLANVIQFADYPVEKVYYRLWLLKLNALREHKLC